MIFNDNAFKIQMKERYLMGSDWPRCQALQTWWYLIICRLHLIDYTFIKTFAVNLWKMSYLFEFSLHSHRFYQQVPVCGVSNFLKQWIISHLIDSEQIEHRVSCHVRFHSRKLVLFNDSVKRFMKQLQTLVCLLNQTQLLCSQLTHSVN